MNSRGTSSIEIKGRLRLIRESKFQTTLIVAAASVVFCMAFLALVSSMLIRGRALETGFYISVLDRTHAFDRVYDDLLADPEFAETIDPLFGELGVDRAIAVSTVRFIAPPEQLRIWTEDALERPISYLRGDVQFYTGDVELSELLDNQRSALEIYIRQLLIASPTYQVDSMNQFELELEQFVRELLQGRIPASIPEANVSPQAAERITDILLGPLNGPAAAAIRPQVYAYASLNDIVGALTVVAPIAMDRELSKAGEDTLSWIGGDPSVDPTVAFTDVLISAGAAVSERLENLRSTINTYSPVWLPWVALAVMAFALIVLVVIMWNRGATFMAPAVVVITGLSLWMVSVTIGPWLLETIAGNPLAAAQVDAPSGWGLPGSARILVSDINNAIFEELARTAATMGLLLVIPGLVLLLLLFVTRQLPLVFRGRYDHIFSREAIPVYSVALLAISLTPLILLTVSDYDGPIACNGRPELCNRPYDEVIFPATHNSMSNSSEGWLLPSQDVPIPQQLQDGVRALLIDSHYWQNATSTTERLRLSNTLTPAGLQLLDQLMIIVGPPPQGAFLCHTTCWLGATPIVKAFEDVRQFLDTHPNEVVTLIIQDAISAEDTVEAFIESGLISHVYTPSSTEHEWPTLRELIQSDSRLIVMTEFTGPPPGWYLHAWDYVQDTPFDSRSQDELNCALNRGSDQHSLFLMNHWINASAPDRVDAAMINSYDVIVSRALECELERGQLPNFISVDFHRQGELLKAVNYLNSIAGRVQ